MPVAVVPVAGTYGMEAVARQFARVKMFWSGATMAGSRTAGAQIKSKTGPPGGGGGGPPWGKKKNPPAMPTVMKAQMQGNRRRRRFAPCPIG